MTPEQIASNFRIAHRGWCSKCWSGKAGERMEQNIANAIRGGIAHVLQAKANELRSGIIWRRGLPNALEKIVAEVTNADR